MDREFDIFEASFHGKTLIEAGAGTGKTYNIASLFVRAVIEQKLLPSQILVLTYTEAATAELKQRLRKRLSQAVEVLEGKEIEDPFLIELLRRYSTEVVPHLKRALYAFDEANISTIHGFCQRLLKEYPLEFGVNPGFEILPDESEVLQETVDHFWRNTFSPTSSEFEKSLQDFLASKEIYPEKLFQQIKPALDKPFAKLVPEPKDLQEFDVDFAELKKSASHLKTIFSVEEEAIKEILDSEVLNGNKYRNRDKMLEDVSEWIKTFEVPGSPHEKLVKFGRYLPEQGLKQGKTVSELELFGAVDTFLESFERFSRVEVAFYRKAVSAISCEFKARKKRLGVLGYNDLLFTVSEGLKSNSALSTEIERRFPIGLIDEFQDTDVTQYSIFKSVYSNPDASALFLIGDPKQAIYSFRGADLNTYLRAKFEVNENNRFTLSRNFRSSKPLIQSVNALFKFVPNPFLNEEVSFLEAQFPDQKDEKHGEVQIGDSTKSSLQWVSVNTDKKKANEIRDEIANSIATEIIGLFNSEARVNGEKLRSKDFAVLTNTHAQAQQIQDVLKERGLKSIIKSKESVFHSAEADDLYRLLLGLSDPGNEAEIRSALATEFLGYQSDEIARLLDDVTSWNGVVTQFQELNSKWMKWGFLSFSGTLVQQFNIERRLVSLPDSERKWTNFYHLMELLQSASRKNNLSIHGLLRYFRKKMNTTGASVSDDEVIRLESDAELIQIVTMHASKGLEFPVVFCPFLWESRTKKMSSNFSFSRKGDWFVDLGSPEPERNNHLELLNNDQFSESIRLAYVALTRAESLCFLYVDEEFKKAAPLSYLVKENETLKKLIESGKVDIQQKELEIENVVFEETKEDQDREPTVSTFARSDLEQFPVLTSFSALSGSKNSTPELNALGFDYDETVFALQQEIAPVKTKFTLPKGKHTGTLLHSIFEQIDFKDSSSHEIIVEQELETFGFDSDWKLIVKSMVKASLSNPLKGELSLDEIPEQRRLIEMEFHFPVHEINHSQLLGIIRGDSGTTESSVSGYMKGFIDLVFEWGGKYYILDYKSNHLGDFDSDYSSDALQEEIIHSQYDLQYHIYTVALVRYLKQRIPGFNYESDFGGVFYLFLRGVNPDVSESGVFFDKPDFSVIEQLDQHMKEGIA